MEKKHITRKILFTVATLGLLGFGAHKIAQKKRNNNRDKEETTSKEVENAPESFGDFKSCISKAIPEIMLETIMVEGTKLDENGLCKPYDDGTGVWTIGFGLTELDGKPVTPKTRHITLKEAYDLAVAFYEERETFFMMWCYEIGIDSLDIDTPGKAFCLASIFYNSCSNLIEDKTNKKHRNRNGELRALYDKYGDNVTIDQVRAVFDKYPCPTETSYNFGKVLNGGSTKDWANVLGNYTPLSQGRGLYWRRWLEGQMAIGNLTGKDLLDLPVLSMTDFWEYIGGTKSVMFTKKDGKWNVNPTALPKFKEWAKKPVDKAGNEIVICKDRPSLRQLVVGINPNFISQIEKSEFNRYEHKKVKKTKRSESKEYKKAETGALYTEQKYVTDYDAAVSDFNDGDYQSALIKYKAMLKDFPNDALILNDMAATYNNLGKYDEALECTSQIFNVIKDKDQYAAAYYNAGVARENLGQYESALANYQNAKKHGNKSQLVIDGISRVQKIMAKSEKTQTYTNAANALNARSKTNKVKKQNVRTRK